MPELPEVETVMRGIAAQLEGRVIRRAALARGDLRRLIPPGFALRLTGARVIGFRRRGKYILMRLAGGDSVLIHLGMSGRMAIHGPRRGPSAGEARASGDGDGGGLAHRLHRPAALRAARP